MSGRRRLAAVALAGSLAACGGPSDPVDELLEGLQEAVADRDADALRERLAPGFSGPGGMDRAGAWQTARRFLLGYENASVVFYDLHRQPQAGGARVAFEAEFSGRPRALGGLSGLLPPDAVYAFELELQEHPQGWLVTSASWERRNAPGSRGDGVSSSSGEAVR